MFAAECRVAEMWMSTSKFEAMVFCLKNGGLLLWVGEELLHQAREFKYFHKFTIDGTIEEDMGQCFGDASVVMQALY